MAAGDVMGGFFDQALILAIGVTRTAAAFTLMPLLTPETVPPLVRNSLFVGFALIVIAIQPEAARMQLSMPQWVGLFGREAIIGLVIGFFFATILWAFEAAGQIIDAKSGATMAQIVDPLSGATTSLNGAFLGRMANFVFMFSGGLLLLVTVLVGSYAVFPISPSAPRLSIGAVGVFEGEFSRVMALAVTFAAPALVLLTIVEGGMGLMNRFAPQLNVFSLSLAIKAWLATLIVLATSGLLVDALMNEIASRPQAVNALLRGLARPPGS